MLLETLTLDCLNIKQCLADDTIKHNLNFYGGAIFRLAKPKYEITGREDSFYENFVSNSTLIVKSYYVVTYFRPIKVNIFLKVESSVF